ncbi:MAG: hypothetical protein KF767_02070 [Bdellovibrionaceae bacterium]|nr:hypothetical protein [Pseudobdellovibrionaceae bacterium]
MKYINLKPLKLMAVAVMGAGMMILSGCGSSSSGGSPATPPITVVPQTPCLGNNCVYQTPNSVIGFYSQSANFPSGLFMNNGSVLQPQGAVVNILQDAMGVCNRGYYNGGYADCQNWVNGIYDLVFLVNPQNPNQVTVIFRAYPQQQSYTYNLPRWDQFFMSLMGWPVAMNPQGTFNPMILTSTIHPVNNSQGFEIRTYGPQVSAGYNKLLQLQVPVGKIEDQNFNYELFWNGDKIAIGTLVRCQTPTCGL